MPLDRKTIAAKTTRTAVAILAFRELLLFEDFILAIMLFMENKIGMGILYIFTGGLFGIGILVDIIKYIIELSNLGKDAK